MKKFDLRGKVAGARRVALSAAKSARDLKADELPEELRAMKAAGKREKRIQYDVNDTEFWVAVCFDTREQKERFLSDIGLLDEADKYLSAHSLAKAVGVPLMPTPLPKARIAASPRFRKFALDVAKR